MADELTDEVEKVARAVCAADETIDGAHWTWDEADDAARKIYRQIARAAIDAMRGPTDDTAAAVERPEPCHSRGPRIGSEGTPLCRLPLGHAGAHRPDVEDGWGAISWGGPR